MLQAIRLCCSRLLYLDGPLKAGELHSPLAAKCGPPFPCLLLHALAEWQQMSGRVPGTRVQHMEQHQHLHHRAALCGGGAIFSGVLTGICSMPWSTADRDVLRVSQGGTPVRPCLPAAGGCEPPRHRPVCLWRAALLFSRRWLSSGDHPRRRRACPLWEADLGLLAQQSCNAPTSHIRSTLSS